jgi:hypothetical protein
MGQPDQWLKAVLADETPTLTGMAAVFEAAPEIATTELRPDGLLRTTTPAALQHLASPWSLLRHEAVFDGKMPGDHVGPAALQRCTFRREARQAQRLAHGKGDVDPNPDDCAAWVLAPHVAAWLRAWERAGRIALVTAGEGCWWVRPSMFPVLWIAANELPLREELIPFLTARTGTKLAEFVAWVQTRRAPEWLFELMYARPEVAPIMRIQAIKQHYTPEEEALLLDFFRGSKIAEKVANEGRDQGLSEGIGAVEHQFARRLGRPITPAEHAELLRRVGTLGAARIGDVVLDLAPDALAAWLADPDAT